MNRKLLASQVEEELMDYILQEPVNVGDKIPNELQSSDDSEAKTGTVLWIMHKKQGEKKCIPLFFYQREVFLEIHQMYLACVVAAVAGGATGFLVALVISFFV